MKKGFHQPLGIDFQERFNPVIKPTTIRTVLSIAVQTDGHLNSLTSTTHSCKDHLPMRFI